MTKTPQNPYKKPMVLTIHFALTKLEKALKVNTCSTTSLSMKKTILYIITPMLVVGLTGLAQASLIDDHVLVEHHFPFFGNVDTDSGGGEVTVWDDATEIFGMHFGVYDVDIEENGVTVDFLKTNRFGSFDFNGLVLSDLDDSEEGYILLGVDVETNMEGWDDYRLIFGDDFVGFNWEGLTVDSDTTFDVFFEFGPNPIPIPATLFLFVTGIAGFSLLRRKIKN
jgi:hypothetical protein